MNRAFSQVSRMGRLSTVLGSDVLVLQRFEGAERLNDLFEWTVDCLAVQADIDFDALIGTHATVSLTTRQGARAFDGIVTEARWLGAGDNGHRYRLVLKPWVFLASLRRNQRIFHNKTVVQILTDLLSAYADAGPLTLALSTDYPVLEYTVQYRETDLAFATRLMERHGISYHFTHSEGGHEMVLTDTADAHASIGARAFRPNSARHPEEADHFWEWRPARRITTGAVRLTDYNFKTPTAAMETDQTGDAAHAQGGIESFDWPGGYPDQGRGRVVARLRAGAERGQDRRFAAEGDVIALAAGARVTLTGEGVSGAGIGLDEEHLCLAASHSYTSDGYGSGAAEGDGYAYSGRYLLMPATAPMLPELKTPRADVKGPQTAVVVGEGEIDCDEYGRILVRFHWDLAKANSMRCRVSQSWAGAGWGGMVIPRVGMEVVVEFLDGDPDQPLVTGCVYNGRNKVPYELPAHKTRSTFRTDTHHGTGFNELRFEDEVGEEEVYLHAQKDRNEKTLNNHTERIDNNWVQSVGRMKASETGGNRRDAVVGGWHIHVGPQAMGMVATSNEKRETEGISSAGIRAGSGPGDVDGYPGNFRIDVENHLVETVGTNFTQGIGQHAMMSVGKKYTIGVGDILNINAANEINISCGASSIRLTRSGKILVNGVEIDIVSDKRISLLSDIVKIN